MGFSGGGVWVMGYGRLMGYGMHFPAHQLGGLILLWDITGYGFSRVWVITGSTVVYKPSVASWIEPTCPLGSHPALHLCDHLSAISLNKGFKCAYSPRRTQSLARDLSPR